MSIHVDTSKLNHIVLKQPLQCGGGILTLGSHNGKSVSIVDLHYSAPLAKSQSALDSINSEGNILINIHELMHCYQPKILKEQYGNLRINPDLNYALYGEIEGKALLMAYEQKTFEEALPYMKDFCVARSIKIKDLTAQEKNMAASDEFREGEAVYAEFTILRNIRNGYKNVLTASVDPYYKMFQHADDMLGFYKRRLNQVSARTFDIYSKNYAYGCFQALLLQKYFPGWQKEIQNGSWLDEILFRNVNIEANDSLISIKRFKEIYHSDSLREVHYKLISGRDNAYKQFKELKGRTYVISVKPVKQYLTGLINKEARHYDLGLIYMYPEGLGDIRFDSVSISFKPIPAEINQLYFIKVIDRDWQQHKKPYEIIYKTKDKEGFYYGASISTPLFTMKVPKLEIRESSNRVKFIIHSRI
jgi:hypothetical protein